MYIVLFFSVCNDSSHTAPNCGKSGQTAMAHTLRRSRPVLALAAAAALALTGCGSGGPHDVETPSGITVQLVDDDHLTTCTTLPYPPFEQEKGDKVVGFDFDIVDAVSKKLGIETEPVDIRFDSIKSGAALSGGTCDVAAGGMTITDERKKNLDFSDPYFDEQLAFMTPKGTTVESIEDVTDQKLKLGVQIATTSLDYATEHGLDPQQFDDAGKELQALRSGTVDVVLQDFPVVNDWLADDEIAADFELGGTFTTGNQYGFGFTKDGDPKLREVFNDVLADMKSDGTYDEVYETWFHSKPPKSS